MLEDNFDEQIEAFLTEHCANDAVEPGHEEFDTFLSWWKELNKTEEVSFGKAVSIYYNLNYCQI